MTAEGRPGEPQERDSLAARPPNAIVEICDSVLGEVGRRNHIFSWLRPPHAAAGQWLPVDAYYPANRLVVVCAAEGEHEQLYRELVPAHGLRFLRIDPDQMAPDPPVARASIEAMLARIGPRPVAPPPPQEPEPERAPRERPVARAVAALVQPPPPPPPPRPVTSSHQAAAARAARLLAARRAVPRQTRPLQRRAPEPRLLQRRASEPRLREPQLVASAPRARSASAATALQPPNLLIGAVLAAALSIEVYVGVAAVALGAGKVLLAIGLVLDAGARALGMVAAAKVGRREWAWTCVLLGSPAVAGFALFQRSGPVTVEPGPLAGLLSLLAIGIVVIALAALVLGV